METKLKINNQLSEEHSIKRGVLQGYPLSRTLSNIYMNEIIAKCKQIYKNGITLLASKKINSLLFAEDQVIAADSKENSQSEVFTLQNTAKNFGMEISTEKFETMAFLD